MDFKYPVINTYEVGQRIRELRMQNHLSVEMLSYYMGFESVQAIYKWQRGESLPTVDNLYALSKVLGTTMEYILEGNREFEDDEMSSSSFFCSFFKKYRECLI